MELLIGLITGVVFGFLLQRAHVLRYDKQLGALRLQDLTIVKFMLAHILVAMVGLYLLSDLGLAKLSLKATALGANILGGLIFGLGWGLLGYCPGTSLGALGEGRVDALSGILGMKPREAKKIVSKLVEDGVLEYWSSGSTTLIGLKGMGKQHAEED